MDLRLSHQNNSSSVAKFLYVLILLLLMSGMAQAGVIGVPHPHRDCDLDIGDISNGPPDPGSEGPFTVLHTEYDFGDSGADIPNFDDPVELRAYVTYPEELGCGPFPIVFMMHGSHATCFTENTLKQHWPCESDETILANYRGYDYFSDKLVSHGFITVSISANGINGSSQAFNLDARAELFQEHIELWKFFSTNFGLPFGDLFIGKVDLKRIGMMGHSRGGGGVARFLDLTTELPIASLGKSPIASLGKSKRLNAFKKSTPIKAALLVGAVSGDDEETHQVTKTALATLYPYCDGDQEAIPSVAYYDESRYAASGGKEPLHSFTVAGANHNYYNTKWDDNVIPQTPGSLDDWDFVGNDNDAFCQKNIPGSGRLSSAEQRATLIAIGNAFFRTYLKKEKAFLPFLRAEALPPPSAQTDEIYVAYHPKDEAENRLDINRLTEMANLSVNTLGGAVSSIDLERFEYCVDDPGCLTDIAPAFQFTSRRPHDYNGTPVSQLRIAWDNSSRREPMPTFANEIPIDYSDISDKRALQFRAFVDFSDSLNPLGVAQDLRVVLRDGAGLTASVTVSDYSPNLFFPPSDDDPNTFNEPVPHAILNTVRVPLSAFDNVFLTDIRSVEMVFDRTLSGAINITDIAFADEANNKPPELECAIAESQLDSGGNPLVNVGLTVTATDDHAIGLVPEIVVYSDEDDVDTENMNNQNSPDAKELAPLTLRLRSENDNNQDGRVYLVLAKATDNDGALGHACCTATVAASNMQDDIDNVLLQATAAQEMCTTFAAVSEGLKTLPENFFEIGDGPIIGPQQ